MILIQCWTEGGGSGAHSVSLFCSMRQVDRDEAGIGYLIYSTVKQWQRTESLWRRVESSVLNLIGAGQEEKNEDFIS